VAGLPGWLLDQVVVVVVVVVVVSPGCRRLVVGVLGSVTIP